MFHFWVVFFSKLPIWFLYLLADGFFVFSYYIAKYRKKVVLENLSTAFPKMNADELNKTAANFLRRFLYNWAETLKSRNFNAKDWEKKVKINGLELLNDHLEKGESAILMSGHSANWEWSGSAICQAINGQMTVFFKPVKKDLYGKEIHLIRELSGIKAVPKDNALRYLVKTKTTPQVIGMIGDQLPAIGTEKYWMPFLNQQTAFYQGAEKFALAMKYPVYYSKMKRLARSKYEIDIIPVYDGKSEIDQGHIIKRYVEILEESIHQNPTDYLWSHRRWKYSPEKSAQTTGRNQLFIS